jgi:hypothetical protein
VEVFIERGARGQLATWRLDMRRPTGATADTVTGETPWRIVAHDRLQQVDVLHRLTLNRERMFQAQNFVLRSVDYTLTLSTGSVFVADTAEGITALVLLGDGLMTFQPTPKTERGQVRLFAGDDKIESRFDAAFVRVNPYDFEQAMAGLVAAPAADGRLLSRAREIFDEEVSRSFSLDLSDMSRHTRSIQPQPGDLLAEVRTRRWRTLTYVRSGAEAEDVTFFNRERKKNIAIYASPQKLASRGAFYDEDDLTEFDILDHEIDVEVYPDREWLVGTSRMKLRVKSFMLAALNLKLAENMTVSSVTSRELGRLLFLKVRNQNSIVVNLPSALSRDYELTLTIRYQGRIERQAIDSESLQPERSRDPDIPVVAAEPNWLLSNRSTWYPQSPVTDYATSTLRVAVPAEFMVAASGMPASSEPELLPTAPGALPRRLFTFRTGHPVRYLGAVVSRMTRVDAATVALDIVVPPPPPPPKSVTLAELMAPPKPPPVGGRNTVELATLGNRRQEGRARDALASAADILRFYAGLMGDAPYPAFTLAMLESDLPGGHSRPISPSSTTHCRRRRSSGATIRPRSPTSGVHSGARDRAPVVGAGGGLEELSRAVDQRRVRAVLRHPLRAREAGRRRLPRGAAQPAALVDGTFRPGAYFPRLPARSCEERGPRVPRARLQQGRGGAAHAAAAHRRRGLHEGPARLLRRTSLQEGRHRRPAPRHGSGERPVARTVLRPLGARRRTAARAAHHHHQG